MRLEAETIALMNAEIDGQTTDRESAALRDLLEKDPAARVCFEQLRQLCESLDQEEDSDPPARLRAEIMSRVRAARAGRSPGRPSRLWLGVRMSLKYSYAFAAGLIFGIVGYSLISNLDTVVSNGDVTGTMGLYESIPDRAAVWPLEVEAEGITGEARIKRSLQGYLVEFDIGTSGPMEVTLSFDPASLDFGGFGNERGAARTLSVSRGEISWSQEGRQRTYVHFIHASGGPSKVTVSLAVAGKEARSKVFDLPGIE